MCTVCGCGASTGSPVVQPADDAQSHRARSGHFHDHAHHHTHDQVHNHPYPHETDHVHNHVHSHKERHPDARKDHLPPTDVRPVDATRLIAIEQDILLENNKLAALNRAVFSDLDVLALNLVSGPGSGKTTLLVRSIEDLRARASIAVIEGDQETSFDADRIRDTGAKAVQINTGKGCHLDAQMIARALAELAPHQGSVVFIENVGNLVCPAAFDLGEAARVVLLSVPEGDDKPLKYANMFASAELLLITKIDLLPYVPFDVERCSSLVRKVNPQIEILPISATTGEGLRLWYQWVERRRSALRRGRRTTAVTR